MIDRRGRPKPNADLPLSRPIDVDRLPETGLETQIDASSAECATIAAGAGLPAVAALRAGIRVERRSGRRFEVSGDVTARITQICVVSLEPFESEITQPIEISFVQVTPPPLERAARRFAHGPEARPAPPGPPMSDLEDDPPDAIVDGIIDLGSIAYEFFVLGLDLYPRKPGVAFTETVVGEASDPEPSAFAALQRLKDQS